MEGKEIGNGILIINHQKRKLTVEYRLLAGNYIQFLLNNNSILCAIFPM